MEAFDEYIARQERQDTAEYFSGVELCQETEADELRDAFLLVLELAHGNVMSEEDAAEDNGLESVRKAQQDALELVESYLQNEELI